MVKNLTVKLLLDDELGAELAAVGSLGADNVVIFDVADFDELPAFVLARQADVVNHALEDALDGHRGELLSAEGADDVFGRLGQLLDTSLTHYLGTAATLHRIQRVVVAYAALYHPHRVRFAVHWDPVGPDHHVQVGRWCRCLRARHSTKSVTKNLSNLSLKMNKTLVSVRIHAEFMRYRR